MFELACLFTWAITLCILYRTVKKTDKLLPHKSVFIVHGLLLSAFFFAYALNLYFSIKYNHSTGNQQLIAGGFGNLSEVFANFFELTTFFLVVFLMLPLSAEKRKKRSDFTKFLHNGFMDVDHLESAILAQNPELTAEDKEILHDDMVRVDRLIHMSGDCTSIMSSMVVIDNNNDLGFTDFAKFRRARIRDLDDSHSDQSEQRLPSFGSQLIKSV